MTKLASQTDLCLQLSVMIHLQDLIEKVEYFTFDPLFYNPFMLEGPFRIIKRKLFGLTHWDIIDILLKIRGIVKEEFGLYDATKPRFILSIITNLDARRIRSSMNGLDKDLHGSLIIQNIKDIDKAKKGFIMNTGLRMVGREICLAFSPRCKLAPISPLIYNNKIILASYKGACGDVREITTFLEKLMKIKDRLVIPLICFIKSQSDLDALLNFVESHSHLEFYNLSDLNKLNHYVTSIRRVIVLLNQLPGSPVPSRYEKLAYAITKNHATYFSRYSFRSSRPLRILIASRYDAIIAGDIVDFALGWAISKLKGIPLFNDIRDPYLDFYSRSIWLNKLLLRMFVNKADRVFYAARFLKKIYHIDERKAVYVPNASFLDWLGNVKPDKKDKVICYVGSYTENILLILLALKKLIVKHPDTKFLLVGPESPKTNYIVQTLGLQKNMILHKPVSHSELKSILSECIMGLSIKGIGGGGKEFDYAALGLPCVRLVKPGREGDSLPWVLQVKADVKEIANTLDKLVSDTRLRENLGIAAVNSIKSFYNLNNISNIIIQELQRVSNKARPITAKNEYVKLQSNSFL